MFAADPNIGLQDAANTLGLNHVGQGGELLFELKRADGRPASFFSQQAIEACAWPGLYPDGSNHWGTARQVKCQLGMYLRQRVSNCDRWEQEKERVSVHAVMSVHAVSVHMLPFNTMQCD
jgi:hypothetical protein